VAVEEGLPEGKALGDVVPEGLGVRLVVVRLFWLSTTIAATSTIITAMTPTTASILFRLRALTEEGLILRFGRELMPTSITKILFKHISKSLNYANRKEKQEKCLN